jgi:hypothetical protein
MVAKAYRSRYWIPACAGMTVKGISCEARMEQSVALE